MTVTTVGLLLVGIASFVMAVLAANSRSWVSALVHGLAGVLLVLVAFGILP